MAIKELTAAEESQVRWMISGRRHPDRIEAYLAERGCSPEEIEGVFRQFNVRRKHLLAEYHRKRNVRIVGVLIVVGSIAIPLISSGGAVLVVSLGLVAYGIWMALTGSLTMLSHGGSRHFF